MQNLSPTLNPYVNISFEIPQRYYHTRAKLITKNWYIYPNNLELPFFDVEILKKYINNTLAQIEGLRFMYNDKKFCWEMEFGTKPIELTVDQTDIKLINTIRIKKYAASKAAEKAILNNLDEEIIDEYNENDELPGPIPMFKPSDGKWCLMFIYLSYDEEKNTILIEFHRDSGDRISFYTIIKIIKDMLNNNRFLNWTKRLAYLMFCQGIEYDERNNIINYVCNDLLKREICSYL